MPCFRLTLSAQLSAEAYSQVFPPLPSTNQPPSSLSPLLSSPLPSLPRCVGHPRSSVRACARARMLHARVWVCMVCAHLSKGPHDGPQLRVWRVCRLTKPRWQSDKLSDDLFSKNLNSKLFSACTADPPPRSVWGSLQQFDLLRVLQACY